MIFEEFFKKKRIDLIALEEAEAALFSEFKAHYDQMGEKSFDHTKKYWFNKLRRRFPLAPEVKTEKAHIANPLAGQTVTESLIETTITPPPAKLGFAPKFRAGNTPKPAADPEVKKEEISDLPSGTLPVEKTAEITAPKPGFQPRFKMKPKVEENTEEAKPSEPTSIENAEAKAEPSPAENIESKPTGFQPRFKMKPKVEEPKEEAIAEETKEVKPAAYQPRFKMKPKAEEAVEEVKADETVNEETKVSEIKPEETPEEKPKYKPRFVPPKPKE